VFQIRDATRVYEEKKKWKFGHCWDILRHEPKWSNRLQQTTVNNRPIRRQGGSGNASDDQPDAGAMERPEGRDSAKRRRSRAYGDTSSSSAAFEVLNKMNERGQICSEREEKLQHELLQNESIKIKLKFQQVEMMQKQFSLMERSVLSQEKKAEAREKEAEAREKEADAKKIEALALQAKEEERLLSMDLSNMPSPIRLYYEKKQREILMRNGISDASGSQ
jgi:hypothetical protein